MGTWDATIFGNDTSLDIKEEFLRDTIKEKMQIQLKMT